jgi:hypothetical protein
MDATDLDKIVDKLMVFRGKLPMYEDHGNKYFNECTQEMYSKVDELIQFIDAYALCGILGRNKL